MRKDTLNSNGGTDGTGARSFKTSQKKKKKMARCEAPRPRGKGNVITRERLTLRHRRSSLQKKVHNRKRLQMQKKAVKGHLSDAQAETGGGIKRKSGI